MRTHTNRTAAGRASRAEAAPAGPAGRALAWAVALGAAIGLVPLQASAQVRPLPPRILEQIEYLRAEKQLRTPEQRKLGSRLLYASRRQRGLAPVPGVPALRSDVSPAADGRVLVDVRADVTPPLLARVRALGGRVVNAHPLWNAMRAWVPLQRVEALARHPDVRGIRAADVGYTRVVSEGDVAHRADDARSGYAVDGTGIRVGVLSDGVDFLNPLQGQGELPAVTVLPGQAGSGSEGTAMLEILHDLAPGAELLFATAFGGQAQFATNILALRAAGADVIVDDVGYFAEGVFQDDDVAEAVDTVTGEGALYFSSAGNGGNWNDGTSGVWEGDFVGVTLSGGPLPGALAHDYGGSVANTIVVDSPSFFTLHWSDPLAGSGNDYDLYLLDAAMSQVLDASTDTQDGNDDPFEIIDSGPWNDTGLVLVVVRDSGQDRALHLNANRGRLSHATDGQTSGHSAAREAFSVAAVDVASAGGGGGVFVGSEPVETYSSDGPRRIFYEADGSAITPGDLSFTGGELRSKPDIAAADCVSTATPGFAVFCGTSAAAPHAAAVAALLLELEGGTTAADVRTVSLALRATALDIEAVGPDRDSGDGLVMADAAAAVVALPACSDGLDNDLDGAADYPADVGCPHGSADLEDPACSDGLDNDTDGLVDFDGGAAAGLPPEDQTEPDPGCLSGVDYREGPGGCGLGAELAPLVGVLVGWRRRRAQRASASAASR